MGALVQLRKVDGAWGRREATTAEPFLTPPPWGMLHTDDARIAIAQTAGENNGDDRGRVRSVQPHRIGGQD